MKKISIFLLFLFLPLCVFAQDSEVVGNGDDVFRFSPDVQINEPLARDFIGGGGTVRISQRVGQDVFVVGGSIFVDSGVGGDLRAAGNHVVINSNIGGNIAVLAQIVEIGENAKIEGSARIYAQEVIIYGEIKKDAVIDAVNLDQKGTIGGNLEYKKIEPKKYDTSFGWFFRLVGLFGMLVVGLIFVSIFPKTIRKIVSSDIKNPFKDLLYGAVGLIVVPIASVVLMLTIIGFPIGLILMILYLIALYLGQVFVGIILGTYIFGIFKGKREASKFSLMWTMVVGIVILWMISGIPSLGGLIKILAIIWGLGIILRRLIFDSKIFSEN